MKNIRFLFLLASLIQISFFAEAQITHSVSFSTSNLTFSNTVADTVTYTKINYGDLFYNGPEGSPELPVKYIRLIFPTDKDAGTIVINQTSKVDCTLTHYVYPIQPAQPISIKSSPPVFIQPDPNIYNSNDPWPSDLVSIVDQSYFDGKNKIITIAIYPFQYYPTRDTIEFYTQINFTVSFVNSSVEGIQVENRLEHDQKLYDSILYNMVDNPEDVSEYQVKPLSLNDSIFDEGQVRFYQYVIITNDCYKNDFDEFIQWKKRKGIYIGVVTIEDINNWGYTGDILHPPHYIYDDAGKIRTYLRDGYIHGTKYALLAYKIDNTSCPIRYGYPIYSTEWDKKIPTDSYFTDFNSDWDRNGNGWYGDPNDKVSFEPEIFVGRLLINSYQVPNQDIKNWTKKILIYEQNPGKGDYSYLSKLFWMQADGMQNYNSYGMVSENLSMFQPTVWGEYPGPYYHYNDNGMVTDEGQYYGHYGNTKGAQVVAEMNNLYGLISWSCHGGTGDGSSGFTSMSSGDTGTPYWKVEAEDAYSYPGVMPENNNGLDKLTNENYPAIVYTISCTLMPYDRTKSYQNDNNRNCGESFTVNNEAGGVAFLGNTRYGLTEVSDYLYKYFTEYIKVAYEYPHKDYYGNLGIAEAMARFSFLPTGHHGGYHFIATDILKIDYAHNLIGCPETEIWTGTPTIFDASVKPSMILLNDTKDVTITINNLVYNKDAVICLYNEDDIFKVATVTGDINNAATYTFEDINPQNLNDIHVTITAYNYIPYMTDILVNDCEFSSTPLNILQNSTWDKNKVINQVVNIKNGATLTVSDNVKVFFNSQSKIVVEPGGKLSMGDATLTSGCSEDYWLGIEVQGNPNQLQIPQYQGYVQLYSGATIENALIGVNCVLNAYMPAKEDPVDYKSGGIINATGAFFNNNKFSINIEPYFNYDYVSQIVNCRFEYNKEINSSTEWPLNYIKLNTVRNVSIFENTFKGNYYNDFDFRGTGIEALDATFSLNMIPWGANQFLDMTYGIKCNNTNSLVNPEISQTFFNNCWRSIYLSGVTDAHVLVNTINYESKSSATGEEAYGIYLDNCTGYWIEGNIMTGASPYPENGLIINNSGEDHNEIYRNTFENIQVPVNAQNINRNYWTGDGLEILCNNIINCTVNDVIVTYDPENYYSYFCGIKQDQGSYDPLDPVPAGNLFTYASDYINYTNSTPNQVHYAHYSQTTPITYQGNSHYVTPIVNSMIPEVVNHDTQINWSEFRWLYDCPHTSGLPGDESENLKGIEEYKLLINQLQPRIDSALIALGNKMDNGNTPALINRIAGCQPSGYGNLYTDLRKYSPYLSEEVLLTLISKQAFPRMMLYNLMLINTHVAKSPILMDALKALQPPLSNVQLKNIKDKNSTFSTMELDRKKIGLLLNKRDDAYNYVESWYAHDSLPSSYDSLGLILQLDPRLSSKYRLVNYYLNKNDTLSSDGLFNNLPVIFNLNSYEQAEYGKYKQLYLLTRQLKSAGKTFGMMNEQQQQMLINAINDPSLSLGEMKDLNALRQVVASAPISNLAIGKTATLRQGSEGGGKSLVLNYKEPILKPVENKEDIADNSSGNNEELQMQSILDKLLMEQNNMQIYPNPATQEVNVLYNLSYGSTDVTIEIIDITGKSLNTFKADINNNMIKINTSAYNRGIYYVVLYVDGKNHKVEKLVIQ